MYTHVIRSPNVCLYCSRLEWIRTHRSTTNFAIILQGQHDALFESRDGDGHSDTFVVYINGFYERKFDVPNVGAVRLFRLYHIHFRVHSPNDRHGSLWFGERCLRKSSLRLLAADVLPVRNPGAPVDEDHTGSGCPAWLHKSSQPHIRVSLWSDFVVSLILIARLNCGLRLM